MTFITVKVLIMVSLELIVYKLMINIFKYLQHS